MTIFWIGLGGFIGANSRYFLSRAILDRFGVGFPWGTLTVNVIGSFMIGLIVEFLNQRTALDPAYRLFFVVGVLGGFTTYSAFAYETVALLDQERWMRAGANILASNVASIAACILGVLFIRKLA